jgi:MinD-like ATPase involved in chromosome partitioning or flagellar assembly
MSRIISIHSFRGGTGKSNAVANVAVLLAQGGLSVGVIDTDIQSPGIHLLFGLPETSITHALNDYLWGKCDIHDVALDVSSHLKIEGPGKIYLIPASIKAGEIVRVLREGYDVGLLNDGIRELLDKLGLDVLLIDTHPGLNEETLLSIAISDVLLIIMRLDQQDYQGTSVTVDVARKLNVPRMMLIVNKVHQAFDLEEARQRMEQSYNCEVIAVLPHSDEMLLIGSASIFVLQYPDHPLTALFQQIAGSIMRQGA